MSARVRLGGAHRTPRTYDERMDLGHRVAILIALVYLAVVALPAVALVWLAAWMVVAVLAALLLGRVIKAGRPVPDDREGRHRG